MKDRWPTKWYPIESLNQIFNIQTVYVSILCVDAVVHRHVTWHMRRLLITRETYRAFTLQYARDQTVTKRALSEHDVYIVPQLIATGLPWNTQWFVPNWATPHQADVFYFLHIRFGPRAISHRYPPRHGCGQNWPPSSPDINPRDFFLWYYL